MLHLLTILIHLLDLLKKELVELEN